MKHLTCTASICAFLLVSSLSFLSENYLFAQVAAFEESSRIFNTYPYDDPDPVAAIGRIYPYFRFDGYAYTSEPRDWKMVTLENDYIKVFITPEIGGKIWGAKDKTTGKMFIYFNQVVKFRDIALRGPWTSGGIESNFGTIGHAPTGSTPVDYLVQENSDSSVSCVIGALDLASRTSWRVEIRLAKDKAFFETNVLWHNYSPLGQSNYHWMNAAARAADDLQFFFPGGHFIGHDGVAHDWPIDNKQRNLSFYINNNFGGYKSYHVLGQYSGWFGGYYYQDQYGFGKWSSYVDKPGKKLWIWGLSRQGMIWEDLLTDTDGQYIEWQSGRLFNQAAGSSSQTPFKHREFPPNWSDVWQEIWFPVKQTEGITKVSPYGILNMAQVPGRINFYFCPLQPIRDQLTLKMNDTPVYTKKLILNPLQVFKDSIRTPGSGQISLKLGNDKLSYVLPDDEIMLNRPLETPAGFNWHTVQGMAIKAAEAYRQRNYGQAIEDFSACLEMDPFYMDALTGMAELHFRMMSYDTALVYAQRALSVDTYHDKANFLYGLINRQIGNYADAADGFSIAAHSPAYRSASYAQLARLAIVKQQWSQAAAYASQSLAYNEFNLTAYQVMIIASRKMANKQETQNIIHTVLALDPLNHFARFENYLLSGDPELLYEFQNKIRSEFPHETFLELAVTYHNLGLDQESTQVLGLAPVNPIVFYWRAYLSANMGQKQESEDLLRKADVQSPYLIFPFRTETVEPLQWAVKTSQNWKSSYYLALLYWHIGRSAMAGELFAACTDQPDYAPFYLTRAKFFQSIDSETAIRDCLRAVSLDQSSRRAWIQLSQLYELTGNKKGSLQALARIYEQNPADYRVAVPFSGALYRSEEYDSCLKVIEKTNVLPFEGAGEARRIYHQAHLMAAINAIQGEELMAAWKHLDKSRLWPENLGAGKPYHADERFENYLQMILANKLAQPDKAEEAVNAIISQTAEFHDTPGPNDLLSALVVNKKGNRSEAQTILEKWSQSSANNFLAFWAMARLDKNINAEKRFYEKIKDRTDIQIYLKAAGLLD